MSSPLHVAVDTREQAPWHFPAHIAVVSRRKLDAGDYALVIDDKVDEGFAVERKSLDDFIGTISTSVHRFNREIERMAKFPCKVVVVEGSDASIVRHNYNHPMIQPAFVTSRIVELSYCKGVHIYLAGDAVRAAQVGWRFLLERYRQLTDPFHGL